MSYLLLAALMNLDSITVGMMLERILDLTLSAAANGWMEVLFAYHSTASLKALGMFNSYYLG
jgi:hypothetical protein